ncbi:MAG: SpoIIE family protein phosphatase [Deltaproteobacteria bacterium]|nr:SpoIIE family protein phosphatase [Deltaproteobacteria bacterium]
MAVKLLIVDDEPDIEPLMRQKFRRQVRDGEYELLFARNGFEALEQLRQVDDVDIVLTDINMPEMDGLTLLVKLNELGRVLKAIIVSAYGDMDNIRTAMNRGAADFLTKPIDFQDMEVTVQKMLRELEALRNAVREHDQLLALRHELDIAAQIQQSILPATFPPFPGRDDFELYATMIPAREVGGDFYDFFLIDDTHLALVIGDVSGKGMPAAIFMSMSRTLLKSIALQGMSPADCLQHVNHLLCLDNAAEMFVTIFYAILDTESGRLRYSSGGHNPPMLLRRSGEVETLSRTPGVALGVLPEAAYGVKEVILAPDDALLLYTDGITEAMDAAGNLFSEARLQIALARNVTSATEPLIGDIVAAVRVHAGETPQSDDVTALCVRRLASTASATMTITLRNDLSELARVAALIDEFGEAHGVPAHAVFECNLALDEVLTNIISHGYGDEATHEIIARCHLGDGTWRFEIEDDARPFNPLSAAAPDLQQPFEERPIGGLGIHIVRRVMDELEYKREHDKNVLVMSKQITRRETGGLDG